MMVVSCGTGRAGYLSVYQCPARVTGSYVSSFAVLDVGGMHSGTDIEGSKDQGDEITGECPALPRDKEVLFTLLARLVILVG